MQVLLEAVDAVFWWRVAGLENFHPNEVALFPSAALLQPSALSSWRLVGNDVPVRDSVSSWLSWRLLSNPQTSFRLMQWLGRPIFSQLSTLLPTLPAAVCALALPASPGLPATLLQLLDLFL